MSALSMKSVVAPVCTGRSIRSVARPSGLRAPALRSRQTSVVVRADASNGSELSDKLSAYASKTGTAIKEQWEVTPDAEKPAAIAILIGVVVVQVAIAGTIDSVERLPIIKQFLEFVGIAVSAVYGYRYFTVPEERESWKKTIDSFVSKVTGA